MDKKLFLVWLKSTINRLQKAPKRTYEETLMFKGALRAYTELKAMVEDGEFDPKEAGDEGAYVEIDGVPVDIDMFPDRSVTLEQYKTVRANSEGFRRLYPKLDDEALSYAVENNLSNCTSIQQRHMVTYEETLKFVLVPELLKRLKGEHSNEDRVHIKGNHGAV